MIYLASPYSHPDPAVRQSRFDAVCREAAILWREGVAVFSPIAHSHPIALYGVEGDWETWAAFDRAIIGACDGLTVLCLDGWLTSTGIAAEVVIARSLGIRVTLRYPSDESVLAEETRA